MYTLDSWISYASWNRPNAFPPPNSINRLVSAIETARSLIDHNNVTREPAASSVRDILSSTN